MFYDSFFSFSFRKNKTIYARIGGGDLSVNTDEWVPVEEIVKARMNVYTFQNDIALVKIPKGRVPVIQRALKMPSNEVECLIFGYGSTNFYANGITSNVIRYARTNLISLERCEEIMGRVSAPTNNGQFCAYGNDSDTCYGKLVDLIYVLRFNH